MFNVQKPRADPGVDVFRDFFRELMGESRWSVWPSNVLPFEEPIILLFLLLLLLLCLIIYFPYQSYPGLLFYLPKFWPAPFHIKVIASLCSLFKVFDFSWITEKKSIGHRIKHCAILQLWSIGFCSLLV